MTTLSSLLSDIGPTNIGNAPTFFRVYHTSRDNEGNGGCCCLWTVPANMVSVTFEVYGGGGSGMDGCCCTYQMNGGGSGNYTSKTVDVVAGCQFRICAGGSTPWACNVSNCGCWGCSSYIVDITGGTTIACACGGWPGNGQPGFTGPFSGYTCCWARINGSSNAGSISAANDYTIVGAQANGMRNQFCYQQYWYYTAGGFYSDGGRSYNLCDTTWYGTGRNRHNGDGYRNNFPGGAGFSAVACGGTHDGGTGGAGGMVIVSYS